MPGLPDASLDDDAPRAAFLSWAETEEEINQEASALLLGKVIGNPASILTALDIFAHAKAQRMPELPTAWLEEDAEAAA